MCRREGCDCDAGGLDALEQRLWRVRDYEVCPRCMVNFRDPGLDACYRCMVNNPRRTL